MAGRVTSVPVEARAAVNEVDGSCLRADTTQPGRGAIEFPDGTSIRYAFEFHFVGTNGTLSFRGERSGSAHGVGSFVTPRTPPDLAQKCAGEGVSEAPLDISLVTESPLVSGRRGGSAHAKAESRNGGSDRGESGHPDGGDRANTFSGSCTFSGAVVFKPPLTNEPQPVRQRVRAPGTCSGEFIDRRGRTHQLSDAPVVFSESSHGDNASCAAGTATGRGALRFRHGRIRFAFSETRTGSAALVSLTGAASGTAQGVANVSPSKDPVAIAQQCAGPGLKRVTVDGQLATTPSISG
jgi:hypothetical protein